MRTSCGTQT